MPWYVNDLGVSWKLKRSVPGKAYYFPHRMCLQTPTTERVPEEPKSRLDPEPTPGRVLLSCLTTGQRCICVVDVDGYFVLGAKALGNTEVIGVSMCEYHTSDVVGTPAHRLQFIDELAPIAG